MRPSRQILLLVAGIVGAVALTTAALLSVLVARPSAEVRAAAEMGELVVLVRPAPLVYFPGPDGGSIGFDADLLRLFAAELQLPVRFVTAGSQGEVLRRVAAGEAHIGAGGLYLPQPEGRASPPAAPATEPSPGGETDDAAAPAVLWTSGYRPVELVLICNRDGYKPAGWRELAGAAVAYNYGTPLESQIAAIRGAHPDIRFRAVDSPSPAGLLADVSDGTVNYAIVGSLAAAAGRAIYIDYEVAFPLGAQRELAFAVAPRFPPLAQALDRFLARVRRDGTIARVVERYLPEGSQFQRIDASALHEDIRSTLPQWRALFRDVQEKTGVEWRLLAAIAYQESKWDPFATSESGVRGLMQITEETARQLGISDRLDPAGNVLGAARYLRDLKAKLPARIQEPDRTWLALAAFNIGIGHLEDARVLAQKQKLNPDQWSDVKRALPLLALPEFNADAKYGYARGGMPVAFVDRVRGYYDILLAREAPLAPRLRMASDAEPPDK